MGRSPEISTDPIGTTVFQPVVPALTSVSFDAGTGKCTLKSSVRARVEIPERQDDTVRAPNSSLADWTRRLEFRLAEQTKELARLSRLKRFFSPQVAELIVSDDADHLLKGHRREIVVVFVDLRGFTAFAETAEPEDVAAILSEYQAEIGRLVLSYEGTLERFTGDGIMIFFNDPVPIPDPAALAIRMALDMRDRLKALSYRWHRLGHVLNFGIGIAQGYATVGAIGFEGRRDYAAIGPVTNLASRLCDEAEDGQILVTQRVASAIEVGADLERLPDLVLKGFLRPVSAFNVLGGRPRVDERRKVLNSERRTADSASALRVVPNL
jgi:adenylate cyclase